MVGAAKPGFVLDNSVLCGWFLANQATAYADAVAQRLQRGDAHAPALLQLEFANVLRSACKRLALRRQLPIATRDGALAEAAWAAGVGVLEAA
jgi:predicted nucleic acid-binding protein